MNNTLNKRVIKNYTSVFKHAAIKNRVDNVYDNSWNDLWDEYAEPHFC